ncbi:MAG: nucleotidyltransferase family protein [Bacteroidia bacterium]|nr:nucleotidyltransferase family protein [Bacteroidia bacterium]
MNSYKENTIITTQSMRDALERINEIPNGSLTLFITSEDGKMEGTLTDGDIRRALLKGFDLNAPVEQFMNKNFRYLKKCEFDLNDVESAKNGKVSLLPMLDKEKRISRIIDFSVKRSVLPIDAVIMAGGRGSRLQPLTDETPKPLLKVNDKPIIEYNTDQLSRYGIDNIYITVKYLGDQILRYFGDGSERGINFQYVKETQPLGTLGAISKIDAFENPYVLVMNSDLLTNIDYEDFFRSFMESDADLTIATTPYEVNVPYAVLESQNDRIVSFKEKPTYTYYSNAGIYLMKRSFTESIPKETFYNATDLIESLIQSGKKVTHYPILGYWLDIGKPEDFKKAQEDVTKIKF